MRKFRSSLTSTAASFTSDDTSKKKVGIMKGISCIPLEKFNYKLKKSVNNTIVTDREKEINQPLRRSIISIESSSKIRLDLNGLELTSFPKLDNSNRLEHISLKNNKIRDMTNLNILNSGTTSNLLHLNLYDNHIEHLPVCLNVIQNLKVLMLGKNRIFHINNNIDQLLVLDVLDLHSNFISVIENIPCNVTYLDLSGNKIEKVKNLKLKKLRELNLSSNCIEYLGNGLAFLTNLRSLQLSSNKLR